jgi:lysophospholipase L1-like esterase
MKLLFLLIAIAPGMGAQTYVCGKAARTDAIILTEDSRFSSTTAGFDLNTAPRVTSKSCASATSFFFSTSLPEGNYTITVVLGGPLASVTTVRAEARRLMLTPVAVPAGRSRTESFTVNIRRPQIGGTDQVVKRKPRELNSLDWDSKLTLEFSGTQPSVRNIRIAPADPDIPTVFLAGDSTVVDQDNEPWAAWGQMLPAFFGPGVAVANHAESGETLRSFEGEKRFEKIFSTLKRGDYLFLQFAHNDQKSGSGYVPPDVYASLLRKYIAMTRDKGATPVLVTSMNRRTFDSQGHITDSLAPYPQTMREVAESEHVALIDLNAMSKTLYESVGEPNSRSLFVYANPGSYPGQTEALHDDTHFNSYGAYEVARCVVLGMQQLSLPLVSRLRRPKERFDPAHPDDPAAVALPRTPFFDLERPYER